MKTLENNNSYYILWFFIWWKAHWLSQGLFIYFFFYIWWFYNRFFEKLQGEIYSFLTGMTFHILLCEEMIFFYIIFGKKIMTFFLIQYFFSGNIISLHKRMWKCPQWHLIDILQTFSDVKGHSELITSMTRIYKYLKYLIDWLVLWKAIKISRYSNKMIFREGDKLAFKKKIFQTFKILSLF